MSIRGVIFASAAVFMASTLPMSMVALAAPMSTAPAIESSVPSNAVEIRWRRRWGWGAGAGIVGGVIIGRALTAPYYYGPYYPRSYYYYPGPAYYPDRYDYPGRTYYSAPYREVPVYDDRDDADAEAYCIQRFRSYDPESGTYLGYDGYRHPCP